MPGSDSSTASFEGSKLGGSTVLSAPVTDGTVRQAGTTEARGCQPRTSIRS